MAPHEGCRCFVGGLAWDTTEQDLKQAFSPYGEIVDSKIIKDSKTGRSGGVGVVTFKDKQPMRKAIEGMNGQDLGGSNITVNEAQSRGSGEGGGGGLRLFGYGCKAVVALSVAVAVGVTVGMVILGGPVTAGVVGIGMVIGGAKVNILNSSAVNMGSGFGNSVVF